MSPTSVAPAARISAAQLCPASSMTRNTTMAVTETRIRLRASASEASVTCRSCEKRRSASSRDSSGSRRARSRTPAMTPASAATTNTKLITPATRRMTPGQFSLSNLFLHLPPGPPSCDRSRRHSGHGRAGWHVAGHDRARACRGAAADLYRRHQHGIAADEGVVLDHGLVLLVAVVVASHRPGPDVHPGTDAGVADVAEVAH